MDTTLLLDLVGKGLSTRDIAINLKVGQSTVRRWLEQINVKTKVTKNVNKNKSNCLSCDSEIEYRSSQSFGKFCNITCQCEFEYKNKTLPRYYAGEISNRDTIRKILSKEVKDCCFECGLKDWNDKPIVMIVNHIDGNAGNNMPENFELLCPNCNSQTETFSGRNRGNGRTIRGLSKS